MGTRPAAAHTGALRRAEVIAVACAPRSPATTSAVHALLVELIQFQLGLLPDHAAPIPGCLDTIAALRARSAHRRHHRLHARWRARGEAAVRTM